MKIKIQIIDELEDLIKMIKVINKLINYKLLTYKIIKIF